MDLRCLAVFRRLSTCDGFRRPWRRTGRRQGGERMPGAGHRVFDACRASSIPPPHRDHRPQPSRLSLPASARSSSLAIARVKSELVGRLEILRELDRQFRHEFVAAGRQILGRASWSRSQFPLVFGGLGRISGPAPGRGARPARPSWRKHRRASNSLQWGSDRTCGRGSGHR